MILGGGRRRLRPGRYVVPALVVAVLGWAAISAIPPRTITIETGPVGGGYYDDAVKYQAVLRQHGIKTVIVPKADSLAIIADVQNDRSGTLVGFAAQDIKPADVPDVASAGRVEIQPLFTFVQRSLGPVDGLGGLRGHSIVLPPEHSATSEAALKLLSLFDVDRTNSRITMMPLSEAVAALQAGSFDAGMFLLSADNGFITAAAMTPTLALVNDRHALAESRRVPFLQPVVLPRGIYDLAEDLPPGDVDMVGAPVDVVVRSNLNPSLGYALLEAMAAVHRGATLVSQVGAFPTPAGSALPTLPIAAGYYRNGVPWVYRELPRSAAVFVDRNLAFVLTLLVLTQVYLGSKWIYELGYFSADQMALLILLWIYRSSTRRKTLSERRVRLVHGIERMLLRQTNKQRRDALIARIRTISEQGQS